MFRPLAKKGDFTEQAQNFQQGIGAWLTQTMLRCVDLRFYMSTEPLSDQTRIAELADTLATAPYIALDTEFLRERTYRAQLCLLQLSTPTVTCCVDPLHSASLEPLRHALAHSMAPKIIHSARQDLEVLWPLFGAVTPVFDTQIAAGLAGMPAQIGYSELVRRLLGVDLAKAETRTDWSKRPLSAAQLQYAVDDVAHLAALRDALNTELDRLGRKAWLDEDQLDLATAEKLFVDPERAVDRLKWSNELDPHRLRLAQRLAAWRERRAVEKDRPRSWILDDNGLRSLVVKAPRDQAALSQLEDLTPGFIERTGAMVLDVIRAADLPAVLPQLSQRPRPEPEILALLKKLGALVQTRATELSLQPEILATRRELESIVRGERDASVLAGWRREVLGNDLLAAAG
jgi:ribonuclease D